MKKLLLSSVIMFGVCSFVTAQNAADSKFKKTSPAGTNNAAVAPAPQKSASAAAAVAAPTTDAGAPLPADKQTSATAPAVNTKASRVAKTPEVALMSADGTLSTNDVAKKQEIQKADAAKPVAKPSKN